MKTSKELIKLAKDKGWTQVRSKGSHRLFKKDERTVIIVVKTGRRDMKKGMSAIIEKRLTHG